MSLAKTTARAESMEDICFVEIPHPMGMILPDAVEKKADDAYESILKRVEVSQPEAARKEASKAAYPADRLELTGSIEDINRHFFKAGWSMGLPVFPPTPERVDALLKSIDRRPDELLGLAPPENATLTVELVAVHGAMAGCKPEYMPVLIAALEAFLDSESNWVEALTTTATTQFLVIINGTVVKELGIGYAQGAAGKGYHPNAAIGYAINLIAYGVGGSRPPDIDRSTFASPGDYVCWVFGENEDRLPPGWDPLHVDRGFKRNDSVVTVMASYPPIANIDHCSVSTEEHLRWWGNIANGMHSQGGPAVPIVLEQNPVLTIGPEHADLMASEGWSKADFKKAFWEQTRLPLSEWPKGCKGTDKINEKIGPLSPDSLIPITLKPEQFEVLITGGDGKHSNYFPPFPGCYTTSRLIKI